MKKFLLILTAGLFFCIFAEDDTEDKVFEKANDKTKDKNESVIKIGGLIEAGFDIHHKVNQDSTEFKKIGVAEIEFSARPVKKVRAEIKLKYKNDSLRIDKLYGQYNFLDFATVRAGFTKKSFGLDETYFYRESIITSYLESEEDFRLLNHELTLQYRHKFGDNWRAIGGFSWAKDTLRYHQNYSVEYENERLLVMLAAIIGHYTLPNKDYTKATTFATSLAAKHCAKFVVSEVDVTYGSVVYEDEDFENINILGIRAQEYFPIAIPTKALRQIIPIGEIAWLSEDIETKTIKTQLRGGLTFGFAKNSMLQWRNTYSTILRKREKDSSLSPHRRRFDSQIVVLF